MRNAEGHIDRNSVIGRLINRSELCAAPAALLLTAQDKCHIAGQVILSGKQLRRKQQRRSTAAVVERGTGHAVSAQRTAFCRVVNLVALPDKLTHPCGIAKPEIDTELRHFRHRLLSLQKMRRQN